MIHMVVGLMDISIQNAAVQVKLFSLFSNHPHNEQDLRCLVSRSECKLPISQWYRVGVHQAAEDDEVELS